jgi:hypothetical protein
MAGLSRVLPVPYFVQPTPITCQSTVLKMMSSYLEENVVNARGAADRNILDIWKDINEGNDRPVKARNAHANMKWWLEKHFTTLKFKYMQLAKEDLAIQAIIGFIDSGFPALVSISHARVEGHIILAIIGISMPDVTDSCQTLKLFSHRSRIILACHFYFPRSPSFRVLR